MVAGAATYRPVAIQSPRGLRSVGARMIAGAGFALMAMHLANERSTRGILKITPYPRGHCNAGPGTPSREYYRIIDRAGDQWIVWSPYRRNMPPYIDL